MKMTSFKVFALCVAIVCLTSVARASPVLKLISGVLATTENPIIENHGCRKHKNLVVQNVVDLKTYDSMLITNEVVQKQSVHEPMVSQKLHQLRRTFDNKEDQLTQELDSDNNSSPVDSKEVVRQHTSNVHEDSKQSNEVQSSEQSNEVQDSQQTNEVPDSEQTNEVQNSEQSNEVQSSEQSNEVQDSQQTNEVPDSEQSNNDNEKIPRELPDPDSYESEETEGSHESGENTDDDKEDREKSDTDDTVSPSPSEQT
ncbi:transcription initiation factor TFIID subunit 11-like [Metopolophium dirhodum]|uniref:transcription initiation factor TFIID subunit 11-like n=1 Tax=Metopolophium dirhodum TaxID=44670 RepID=UPI00298F415F|nr:transcription initiation factor TFIID subunit 11-like [Metopolophium dirhodum]